jgi:uncharacterized membrane protein YcaP (DUF421 family)
METVLRGLAVYLVLFAVFRVMGKRALSQITTFDFVLLLIISETTQQALVGDDQSVLGCTILVATLLGADLGFSLIKRSSKSAAKVLDDVPLLIVRDGVPLRDRMEKARVDEDDVLGAAREIHGLSNMGQIRHAILEQDGEISIIPR